MSDFFVIAEEELVIAFRLVGIEGHAASGRDEALAAFREATSGRGRKGTQSRAGRGAGAKVLILTEEVMDLLEAETKEWQMAGDYPLIVEIPSQGARRPRRKGLVDAVREAIGVRI